MRKTGKGNFIPHLPTWILAEYLSKRHTKTRGDLILCRHIGHNPLEVSSLIHSLRQCWRKCSVLLLLNSGSQPPKVDRTIWKECPQFPITRSDLLSNLLFVIGGIRAQTYKEDNHRQEIYKLNRSRRIERDIFHRPRHQACPISMRRLRSILWWWLSYWAVWPRGLLCVSVIIVEMRFWWI